MTVEANGTRALLVDDLQDVATIIEVMLRSAGIDLDHVTNGQDALDYLAEKRPDLILIDIGLPGMSGWDLLDHIRENSALAELPVIIITAYSDSLNRKTGKLRSVDAYLVKPIMPEKLRNTVQRVLAGKRGE